MPVLVVASIVSVFAHRASAQHPQESSIMTFLAGNVWPVTGLPRSYFVTDGYWQNIYSNVDRLGYNGAAYDAGRQQERFITQYGLNLYDGACWQIAMCLSGGSSNIDRAAYHTRRLKTNVTQQWTLGTRGYTKTDSNGSVVNLYGDGQVPFWGLQNEDKSFYFRVISELYSEWDPLPGTGLYTTWEDWKPVTGENAWCNYIGPLQTAWHNFGGRIPWTDPAIDMGYSLLDAVSAMQCKIGALYHVPSGVAGKAPNEISNENNFSMYAGLRMFRQVLQQNLDAGGNLLRNPGFEDQGAGAEDALSWQWTNPDNHGATWGNAGREAWATHSGGYLGAIRGTWAGVDYGGWWQEAPTHEGLTNTFTGWFKRDIDWTAGVQEWKIEFYDDNGVMVGATTSSLAGVGTDWGQLSLQAASPAGATWARAVIAVANAGASGALQFDDLSMTASPGFDLSGTVARVTTIMTNMDNYFAHYLYNTNDHVFHTGGIYTTNGAGAFSPYVFDGYWVGGPYRGSNTFSGVTEFGAVYSGTNLYDGYSSVDVTLATTNNPPQVNIQVPAGSVNEYIMTKISNNLFRYTITGLGQGQTASFKILVVTYGWGPDHSWNVQVTDPPLPYTTRCTNLFAIDCQTWGMTVLGAQWVDNVWGEGAAFNIWQKAKQYAGFYATNSPALRGVGFSDVNNASNDICTAEWTFGAILMCRELSRDYWEMGRPDLAQSLAIDAETMRASIEDLKVTVSNITTVTTSVGSGSQFTYDPNWADWGSPAQTNVSTGIGYLYANKRYEIPFGWWANPLPSLASTAWSVMTDRDFNPFILGGRDTNTAERLIPWLTLRSATTNGVTVEGNSMKIGLTYKLQRTADLANWQDLSTNVATYLTDCTWSNIAAAPGAWFYRLKN